MIEIAGRQLDVVTLDFETAWGQDYTLSKMPTSKYVRDERFLAFMCGIKFNDQRGQVWSTRDIPYALKQFDWSRTALLAHNTAFDGFVMTQRYGIRPAFYLDTLSMARGALGHAVRHDLDTVGKLLGVGGKEGKQILVDTKDKYVLTNEEQFAMASYCAIDVQRCYDVFHKLYNFIPDDELELIDLTLRMFCEPSLEVNRALVEEELEEEVGGKVRSLLSAGCTKEHLLSNQKFMNLLVEAGLPYAQMKISKRTGKAALATSKDDLAVIRAMHKDKPEVVNLIDARLKVKSTIGESRAQAFIDTADGGTMPVLLNYYGAHTGRWSGGNKMNLQNLPRGGRLRRSLTAPKGYQVVVADSSQIEARVNAWLWGQQDLVEAFRRGDDIYSQFASTLYGRPIDRRRVEIDPATGKEFKPDFTEGFVGKTAILGLGFQMGTGRFYDTVIKAGVPFTMELAGDAVDLYRRQNNMIARGWKFLQNVIPKMTVKTLELEHGPVTFLHEAVRLPNGMFLRYPELRLQPGQFENTYGEASFATRRGARTKLYGGLMCENIVQALARIIVAGQMLQLHREGVARMVLMTHDEIVGIAPNKKAERSFERMIEVMSTPPEWAAGLPLAAEGGFAQEYSK